MDRKNEVPAGKENYYVLPVVNWHKVCVQGVQPRGQDFKC